MSLTGIHSDTTVKEVKPEANAKSEVEPEGDAKLRVKPRVDESSEVKTEVKTRFELDVPGSGDTEGLGKGSRERKLTEKGKAYAHGIAVARFTASLSAWHKHVCGIEVQIGDCRDANKLRICREELEQIANTVIDCYLRLTIYETKPSTDIAQSYKQFEASNLNTLQRVTDAIRDIEYDSGSKVSGRSRASSHGSVRSKSSKSSRSTAERKAMAEEELAALQAKLQYSQSIAMHRAELERLESERDVRVAEARLQAIMEADEAERALNPQAEEFVPAFQAVPTTTVPPATFAAVPSTPMENQMESLIKSLALSRLPPPEPGVFQGDPKAYSGWKSAFDTLIDSKGLPPAERIHFLKKYVGGDARFAIKGFLDVASDQAYEDARHLLDQRFGDPFVIANAFREELELWSRIQERDGPGLRRFSDFLRQCLTVKATNANLRILDDEYLNRTLKAKLPREQAGRWGRRVSTSRSEKNKFPDFKEFANFVRTEADYLCDPVNSYQPPKSVTVVNERKVPDKRHAFSTKFTKPKSVKCALCKHDHHLDECRTFLQKPLAVRKQYCMEHELCFGCLADDHKARECQTRCTCKTCGRRHPTSLHGDMKPGTKTQSKESGTPDPKESGKTVAKESDTTVSKEKPVSAHSRMTDSSGGLGSHASCIIPVMVSHRDHPEKECLTYALMDNASTSTFILESTRESMGIRGPIVPILLSTLTASEEKVEAQRITGLIVRGIDKDRKIRLPPTYSRSIMPVDREHIPTPEAARAWPHLEGIAEFLHPLLDCEVGLLLGSDCTEALCPRDVVCLEGAGPWGQKSYLGWSICGLCRPVDYEDDVIGTSHRIVVRELGLDEDNSQAHLILRTSVKELRHDASLCPQPVDVLRALETDFRDIDDQSDETLSQDDLAFMRIMKEGIHTTSKGQYEMPLPLRAPASGNALPNNKSQALSRLAGLRKRMLRDTKYHEDYVKFMNDVISKGYAEEVPDEELDAVGPVWYIPHHGVRHPQKPDKLRVVFDCSARHAGTSLNDHLLTGPDMLNRLVGVLLRFRCEPYAFTCDVESMFYRFQVAPSHRDFLRFLWWKGGQLVSSPVEYRMTVHVFGAVSSPACATYGLRQLASDGEAEFGSAAADFLRHNFYVDDGLKSLSSPDEAIQLIKDVRGLCAKGDLHLHKFLANSKDVMSTVPEADRAAKVSDHNLLDTCPAPDRVLGVVWGVESDVLGFKIVLKDLPFTRRGVLATVSTVYDPTGLAAPVVLRGKLLLQELCALSLDWDDPLPERLVPEWRRWREDVLKLADVKVSRCVKPVNFGVVKEAQLHTFADASFKGYGACSYLRLINEDGEVHCSFIMGKARVSPIKAVTIPRLELTAAVLSVRLSSLLQKELEYDLKQTFWTDSKVVLGYLNNDKKRFHVYVANRVQQIKNKTSSDQWRYVNTQDNPADLASRGLTAEDLAQSVWLKAPDFLRQRELPPPEDSTFELSREDPEVRKTSALVTSCRESTILDQLKKVSGWRRMVRVVALCLGVRRIIQQKQESQKSAGDMVTVEQESEQAIIRLVQKDTFGPELDQLHAGKGVLKSSSIFKLEPFLDSKGIMRVKGRVANAPVPFSIKHPVILPKGHHMTEAVVRYHHQQVGHQGRGMTTNSLRNGGYWVIGMSRVVSKVISNCVVCRKLRIQSQGQKMAELPDDRLQPAPPFTHCGVDCFGPWYIKERRKEMKRYGVLFTCLSSRAVHIETTISMDSSSFINALRRFISIRGPIRVLRSDQGTNFIGAQRELREALAETEQLVREFLLQNQCEYILNPPHASHMGGVWERQIRSVRNALSTLLHQSGQQLNDEALRTLMCEAAAIVNSRPLTTDNLNDPQSLTPITPNQLLTGKTSIVLPPPGQFMKEDMYSRKYWRRVQYLANQFWQRWKKEFLKTLQERPKWNKVQRDLQVDDIVIVKDDALPRCQWRLARVTEVMVSHDNRVRRVKVRVGDPNLDKVGKRIHTVSSLERPIHQLVLLLEAEKQ